MKKAILIHGWPQKEEFFDIKQPSPSNAQWFPWLQKQLSVLGFNVQTPEMPNAFEPNYNVWKEVFENYKLDEDTILVGHSCGGGFLVRWLSENNVKVGKVILVAPWIDPNRNEIDPNFFDFEIDEKLCSKASSVVMIYSDNDIEDVMRSVEILKEKLSDLKLIEMKGRGHFCLSDLGGQSFLELLSEIINS